MDDEDEDDEPSSGGKTVAIVAVGVIVGTVVGIFAGVGYYNSTAPKVPGAPSQPTKPASSPAASPNASPNATPHTFVPPAPGDPAMAYRLVAG
jgi:hypothetical protein